MANRTVHRVVRRLHRYLGVLLGIQFLFWTLGGLYFSWTDLDEIHGDFQRRPVPRLRSAGNLVSPDSVLKNLGRPVDSLHHVQLTTILQQPFWSIAYYSGNSLHTVLADARTGIPRFAVGREEAVQIARESFNGNPKVSSVAFLTTTNGHHEYRSKPLPAWAVTFSHPTNTTVYVSADYGKVESFRNNKWRVFDFLWMMHTMDYRQRDHFNNWLLRAFSLFGLATIFSGFVLFFVSRKRKKRAALKKGE
ncbi:MAG TPA: PepSY domain-containing protein [Chitinophagaceae bacterium]